jgi:phage/plasmid-associated DNA primase
MDELNEAIKQVQKLLFNAENKEFRESLRKIYYELLKKKYEALEEPEETEEEKKELEDFEKPKEPMELEKKPKKSEEPKESEEDPDLHPIKSLRSMKIRSRKFNENVKEEILKFLPV